MNTAAPTTAERTARQRTVVAALSRCVPAHTLLWQAEDTTPYECDGLSAYRRKPLVVALPETEAQFAAVLKACHRLNVPVVALGSRFAAKLPLKAARIAAACVFLLLGLWAAFTGIAS